MAYTTIDDPSKHFQSVIWTGNGASDTRTITFDGNSDMQPDWVWHKQRNDTYGNHVFDSSRGFGANKELVTRGNFVEGDTSNFNTVAYGYVNAATSDGFVVKKGTDSSNGNRYINESNDTHVAWGWKANGGTTTTNDASSTSVGSVDSVYQANTGAGFSIVLFDLNGNTGGTVAHGLGATPDLLILKNRENTASWNVMLPTALGTNKKLTLDSTSAASTNTEIFKNTAPTSTVFSFGNDDEFNSTATDQAIIAYCFRSIQGYSKIGSYSGNGNSNGTFVHLGFKPSWILVKRTNSSESWQLVDTKRSPINVMDEVLRPDDQIAEQTNQGGGDSIDFVSNGFKTLSSAGQFNNGSSTYIYLAFAERPFVSSEGVPTTAR